MSAEPAELAELRRRAGEIADLSGIGGLLLWDQNTMMPPGGADARADQFEALERILHDRITDPALATLLDELEPWAASADPDSDDVGAVHRDLRRDHHKAVNVPTDLAAEISSAAAHAQQAWMAAREASDFKLFQPALERVLELQHRYIACFDGTGEFAHPYDVLLDDYEPGLTTEELRTLFATHPGRARPARLAPPRRRARTGACSPGTSRPRTRRRSPTSCCAPSATTPSTGAWTRPSTRSRAAWPTPTCG